MSVEPNLSNSDDDTKTCRTCDNRCSGLCAECKYYDGKCHQPADECRECLHGSNYIPQEVEK